MKLAIRVCSVAALVALALAPLSAAPPPATTTFVVDGAHSAALFRVVHLGVGAFHGRFKKVSGKVAWDDANPSAGSIEIRIPAASLDSNHAGRDKHLLGPDFFNVKQFPELSFTSTSIAKKGEAFEVKGTFSLRGKSKEITVLATKLGEKDCGPRFGYRAGWEVTFSIKRSDYGMSYGVKQGVLADDVRITVAVECVRK
jgi:polyisoprenoid-binding protein YceI